MAPIPIRLSSEAQTLVSTLQRRQNHLETSQIPALHECKGPLVSQQQLSEELREDLAIFSRQIETLDGMIDDQQGERSRRELRNIVQEFREKLTALRAQMRVAVLASKKAIDSQRASKRDELLSSNGISQREKEALQGNEEINDDILMKANADVTDALRRTIESMQAELERSVLSTQLLESSTAALRATSTQHDTLSNAIETTKYLVTALEKSDWLDRILIISAFVFFLLVVLFILKQRFVDRGIRLIFWWTRFIPDFKGDADLLKAEEGVLSIASTLASLATAVSSTVSLASSVVATPTSSVPALSESILPPPASTVTDVTSPEEPMSDILSSAISSPTTPSDHPTSRTAVHDSRTHSVEHLEL